MHQTIAVYGRAMRICPLFETARIQVDEQYSNNNVGSRLSDSRQSANTPKEVLLAQHLAKYDDMLERSSLNRPQPGLTQ